MITNRHPADELADIRNRIRALKAREQELRKALLGGTGGLDGAEFRAVIRKRRQRVFQKDRLPPHILSDPSLWADRDVVQVVSEKRRPLVPSSGRATRPGDPAGAASRHDSSPRDWGVDEIDLIERRSTP